MIFSWVLSPMVVSAVIYYTGYKLRVAGTLKVCLYHIEQQLNEHDVGKYHYYSVFYPALVGRNCKANNRMPLPILVLATILYAGDFFCVVAVKNGDYFLGANDGIVAIPELPESAYVISIIICVVSAIFSIVGSVRVINDHKIMNIVSQVSSEEREERISKLKKLGSDPSYKFDEFMKDIKVKASHWWFI